MVERLPGKPASQPSGSVPAQTCRQLLVILSQPVLQQHAIQHEPMRHGNSRCLPCSRQPAVTVSRCLETNSSLQTCLYSMWASRRGSVGQAHMAWPERCRRCTSACQTSATDCIMPHYDSVNDSFTRCGTLRAVEQHLAACMRRMLEACQTWAMQGKLTCQLVVLEVHLNQVG